MASVAKFTAGAVRNQLRHNLREIEHSSNADIDPARRGRDYILSPDRAMSEYDYFLQRKSELYCYGREDVKVMAGWIVTAPRDLAEERQGDFFKATYAKLPDDVAEQAREDMVKVKGFFILPSELFENVRARAAQDENLNMTLETVFRHIEDSAKGSASEDNFAGLFEDIDVNSNKLGATVAKRNAMLVKLLNGIGEMKLGNYKENSIDAFGDTYEYLMGRVSCRELSSETSVLTSQR